MFQKITKVFLLMSFLAVSLHGAVAIVKTNANVRETPSMKSKIVSWLTKDTQVDVAFMIEDEKKNRWCKIKEGYISAKLLKVDTTTNIKFIRNVKYLPSKELKKLLLNKKRVGVNRYSKNGVYFKSTLHSDNSVSTLFYDLSNTQVLEIQNARWTLYDKGVFCIDINKKRTQLSCRKVYKNDGRYISVLTSDGKPWSNFILE